jgi:mannose-6-phosphate isomerase-like protein (cupin superfamily)
MKIFKTGKFKRMKDPTLPGKASTRVLTGQDNAVDLEGSFVVFPPIRYGKYHYHKNRECIFVILKGKASMKIEDIDYPIEAGDIIFLSKGEKHTTTNTSGKEFRFIEFYTNPPHDDDWEEVK